jgi:ABC-type multidrug transport system fused ATPase/permease subunit
MTFDKKSFFLFSIGLFSTFYIRVIGSLIVGEILVMLLFLYLFLKRDVAKLYKKKDIRVYTHLLLLAAFSCIMSSMFRGMDTNALLKGTFTILLLIPGLYVFLWLLKDKPYRIIYYLFGGIVSGILTNYYFIEFSMYNVNDFMSIEEALEEQYLYVYLPYFLFAIAISYNKYPKITAISMIGMGTFLLMGMSRRYFLLMLIAACVLFFTGGKKVAIAMSGRKKVLLIMLFCIGGMIAKYGYEELALSGALGESAQAKYEMQASSAIGIASGRSDFFVGLITVWHHPVAGLGFMGATNDSRQIMTEYSRLSGDPVDVDSNRIYGHSSILSWWIFFGVLAVPFWIFVLKQCFIYFNKNIYAEPKLAAYILVCVLSLLWDIFFSPFANRIGYATILVLMFILKEKNKNNALHPVNSHSNL